MANSSRLSPKAVAVLSLIADGHSYGQIVDGHPDITYRDIFAAADEALRMNESDSDYNQRMAKIRKRYPRAYEKWSAEEDNELRSLFDRGISDTEAAEHFGRQPSAISSRLIKLGLA
ncbi:MAG TPA: hypothetical protein PKA82_12915 [Pyrinomonadaceae bacterium]|nr:hypothetical protein [Pyrinomonadaceae bacterium]